MSAHTWFTLSTALLLALAVLAGPVGPAGAQAQKQDAKAQKQDAKAQVLDEFRRAQAAAEIAALEAQLRRRALEQAAARQEQDIAVLRLQAQVAQVQALEARQAVAVKALAAPQQVWPDEQFEQWVFQQDRNAAGAQKKLESLLTLQVEEIDRSCRLTEAQKSKLRLAGRGDIKRYFDRYELVKLKFKSFNNDIQRLQEIQPEVNPLRTTLQAGVFNDDSLLHKSLRNTLTGEQFTRYDTVVRERGASQHRANIERVVTMIEQNTPLRDAQRREFITLLTNETKPARTQSQYDFYLIALQIGRLPEAKLKPLFDDTQWKAVTEFLNRYKGIEPALRQNGVIVDDDREAGGDDALPAAVLKRSDS